MIVWINGAFGSGKTTCAYELARRLPNSFVYDPENVGYLVRKNTPEELHERDFQDHEQWRSFNYEMLASLSTSYAGTIIAPMTLTNRQYYDEIVGRLIGDGVVVKHYILYADKEIVERRLGSRLDLGNSWARSRIDQCIQAFDHDITEEKILTNDMSVDRIVEEIAELSGLPLSRDGRGRLRKSIDRSLVSLRHRR